MRGRNRRTPHYADYPYEAPARRNAEWDSYINDKYDYQDHGSGGWLYNDYYSRSRSGSPLGMRERDYYNQFPYANRDSEGFGYSSNAPQRRLSRTMADGRRGIRTFEGRPGNRDPYFENRRHPDFFEPRPIGGGGYPQRRPEERNNDYYNDRYGRWGRPDRERY